ncbi:hypothetical protein DN629_02670 [Shigella sonnei]|nr:hypothetical protein CR536_13640 [Escherichia coli]EGD9227273.1 hypothetical protein [Shigella sonnei]KDV17748.1 hypothetical protein BW72_07695 [Escherichia coli O78:H12 str. 00-3279]EAA5571302.1 hypothetical protein [Escherichia coli]EEW4280902.1 hypothetical protein [Escherichia coli]
MALWGIGRVKQIKDGLIFLTVGQPTLSGLFHSVLILPVVAVVTLNCLFMVCVFLEAIRVMIGDRFILVLHRKGR